MGPYLVAWTGAEECRGPPVIAEDVLQGGHNLSSKVCKACPTIDWPTYRRQRKVDTRSSRRGGGGGRGTDKRTTVEEGEGEKKKGLRLLSRYYR